MRSVVSNILLLCALAFSACALRPNTVVMEDVNVKHWEQTATIVYNNHSTQERNLSVMLHTTKAFEAEAITLRITMFSPDSLRHSEVVTLPIAPLKSRPSATSTDIEIPYRRGVTLKQEGEYTFQLTPIGSIRGVEAAGINFQSSN